jgi:ABC-type nickel/cobalt efflux system permease component RcnA
VLAALLVLLAVEAAAQSLPGLPAEPRPATEPTWLQGLWAWITLQQSMLRRELVELLAQLKAGNSGALLGLLGGSFLYGVLHAAGPGHGKLIIASYLFANESQVKSGLKLTAVSSLLQALSAILIVGLLAALLDRARLQVARDVQLLEVASYALIVLLGLVMLWRALRPHDRGHDHGHDHDHRHEHHHGHHHGWTAPAAAIPRRDFWAMALSIGIRPCSGAVIVLLFTFGQGLLGAGIAATFAMAVGTAVTVGLLALLALGSRRLALGLASGRSRLAAILARSFAVLGALAVVVLGALFLWVAWSEPPSV